MRIQKSLLKKWLFGLLVTTVASSGLLLAQLKQSPAEAQSALPGCTVESLRLQVVESIDGQLKPVQDVQVIVTNDNGKVIAEGITGTVNGQPGVLEQDLLEADAFELSYTTANPKGVLPLKFYFRAPEVERQEDLANWINDGTKDSLSVRLMDLPNEQLSLSGNRLTGYRVPAAYYCGSRYFKDGTLSFDQSSDLNWQIPSLRGSVKFDNLQAMHQAIELGYDNLTMNLVSEQTRYPIMFNVLTGPDGSVQEVNDTQLITAWDWKSDGPHYLNFAAKDGKDTYLLDLAGQEASGNLQILVRSEGSGTYFISHPASFKEQVNRRSLHFSISLDSAPKVTQQLKGSAFVYRGDSASNYDLTADTWKVDQLFENRDNLLTDAALMVIENNKRVVQDDLGSAVFSTPAFAINEDAKYALALINQSSYLCHSIRGYAWLNTESDAIEELSDNGVSEGRYAIDGTDLADRLSGGNLNTLNQRLVLFADREADDECLDGVNLQNADGVISGGNDGSGSSGGSSGGTSGTLGDPLPDGWGTEAFRQSAEYNPYGIHVLTEQGALPHDLDNEACKVAGNWGFAKGLWYPLSGSDPGPRQYAVDYVNEAYRMHMIPVMRMATYWNDSGMVAPDATTDNGQVLPPSKAASLITQLASARKEEYQGYPLLIQVFNEPNWKTEWVNPDGSYLSAEDRANRYAEYLVVLHAALPEGYQDTKGIQIVSSGLSPAPGADTMAAGDFIDLMLQVDGFTESFDVWGSQGKLNNSDVDPGTINSCQDFAGETELPTFHPCFYQSELTRLGVEKPVFILEAGYLPYGQTTSLDFADLSGDASESDDATDHSQAADETPETAADSAEESEDDTPTSFATSFESVDLRAKRTIQVGELWRADPNVMGFTFWQLQDPYANQRGGGGYAKWDWIGSDIYDVMQAWLHYNALGNPACSEVNPVGIASGSGFVKSTDTSTQAELNNNGQVGNNLPSQGVTDEAGNGSSLIGEIIASISNLSKKLATLAVAKTAAEDVGINWKLLASMLTIENGSFPSIDKTCLESHVGALGLGQLMPHSQTEVAGRVAELLKTTPSQLKFCDPVTSVYGAAVFIHNRITKSAADSPTSVSTGYCPASTGINPLNPPVCEQRYVGWRYYGACKDDSYNRCIISSEPATCSSGNYCALMQSFYSKWDQIQLAELTEASFLAENEQELNLLLSIAYAQEAEDAAPDADETEQTPTATTTNEPGVDETGVDLPVGRNLNDLYSGLSLKSGINDDGMFYLKPDLQGRATVYEINLTPSTYNDLTFDYYIPTEEGEATDSDPFDFSVWLIQNGESRLLYQPTSLQSADWITANADNGNSNVGFDSEGKIELSDTVTHNVTLRFVVQADQPLENPPQLYLRRLMLNSERLHTTFGYDYLGQGADVRTLWDPQLVQTYVSTDPTLPGVEAVEERMHWMHPEYGEPADDGSTYRGSIREYTEKTICDQPRTNVVELTPVSASEPTYMQYDFSTDGGSGLSELSFGAGADCNDQASASLQLVAYEADDYGQPIEDTAKVLWKLQAASGWKEQTVNLEAYRGTPLILRLVATHEGELDSYPSPVYVGNVSFEHNQLTTLAATTIPLATILGTVLPFLIVGLGALGFLFFMQSRGKPSA